MASVRCCTPARIEKRDPFSVRNGRFVGHDGFVVPKNFDEFHKRFPEYVRKWVRRHTAAFMPSRFPSASTENGLGTGRVDHSFTFGASESVAHFNFDFNVTEFLVGQPTESGFDTNQQLALAFSHAIHGKLQFAGEFYGDTQLNTTTPGFASSLWALTYTIIPRLVIDGGYEVGLTTGGPHRHAFLGLTYSITNLYPGWRRKESRNP
jgi:hypothetical protein